MTAMYYRNKVWFLAQWDQWYWEDTENPEDAIGPFSSALEALDWANRNRATIR